MPILLFKKHNMHSAHTNLDSYYYVDIMSSRTIKRKLVLQKANFQIESLYK